ncbi:MAG: hypothetical protein KDI09_13600, partial [Halioglobus sp.]|nr:hypothetical protein [Halioglobus sp.]
MATTFLTDECLSKPLHGVRLVHGKTGAEKGATLATLNVWQEEAELADVGDAIWRQQDAGERYQSLISVHPSPRGLVLKIDCEGKGAFSYTPEGVGIRWEADGTGPAHYFQTLGVGLWLEQRGIPCIHANALAAGDKAIGLIAPSRTGKTTLTAALLGHGLQAMTDDMLALHPNAAQWEVHPGWPRLRMWPDSAESFTGQGAQTLAKVHERFEKRLVKLEEGGAFCAQERPLRQLYLLERRASEAGEVVITDLAPGEAIIHLLQNSILGDVYGALALEAKRLKK